MGAGAGAVAIMKRGEIDAISNLDPVIATLEANGDAVAVVDTRTAKGMHDIYGDAYAAGCIYAPVDFAKKYPNTAQAVVNAMVRALRFIQNSTPEQIVAAVPPEYYSDKALYKAALEGQPRDVQARRSDQPRRPRRAVYRDLKTFDPGAAERGIDRSSEDDQHAVPAEGRAEIPVMAPVVRRKRGRTCRRARVRAGHLHIRRATPGGGYA